MLRFFGEYEVLCLVVVLSDQKQERSTRKTPLEFRGSRFKAIDEFRVRGNLDLESKDSVIGFLVVVNRDKEKTTTL